MFVLGIMLLLMAIGASVMAAASFNIGANMRQNEHNRLMILSDSVQKSLMSSLQDEPEKVTSLAFVLSNAIFEENSKAVLGGEANPTIDDIELELTSAEIESAMPNNMRVDKIVLSFLSVNVSDVPARAFTPAIMDDDGTTVLVPAIDRVPRTATVRASISINVIVEADGLLRDGSRLLTTRATYNYIGFFTDDPTGYYTDGSAGEAPDNLPMLLTPDGDGEYSKWNLVRYEIIESRLGGEDDVTEG